jgi:regulatory protein
VVSIQDKQKTLHHAVSLLARRDHSAHELRTKLIKKGHDEELVERVLEELLKKRYLDDRRYAQMMLRHHYVRGQGPVKIRYLLNQNAVSSLIINEAFSEFDEDWFELAKNVRLRRFGEIIKAKDKSEIFKEKSKQMRFLMTRGFDTDQVQYAMAQIEVESL